MKSMILALIGASLIWSANSRPITDLPVMTPPTSSLLPHPLLLRLAEEFSLKLGDAHSDTKQDSPLSQHPLEDSPLSQHPLVDSVGKRSDEAPLSLDLTFHLLREVLEMALAERLALQASSNQRMMEHFGK